MSFWKMGWGSGSTIKARDSDDLQAAASREELMRNYSATEEMTLDYSKNFKSLNHYASDELKRLPTSFKEDLLNLPKGSRTSIYKIMNDTFSEEAVDEAGGWPKFMSKAEHKTLGNIAQNLVRDTAASARALAKEVAVPSATGKKAADLIGDVDEDIGVEMQEIMKKDTTERNRRDKARELAADKERMAQQSEARAKDEAEAQKLLDQLDALLDSDDDGGFEDDHEDIYGDGDHVGEAGAVEMQVIEPKAAAAAAEDGLGVDFDPFAAEPIASGETIPGTTKQSFAEKVKGAAKRAAKGVKGLFKSGDLEAPPVEENPLIIRGPPPDEMDGKRSMANEEYDTTELTSLLRKTTEFGPGAGIKQFPAEAMAVRGNGEFWITRQGLKKWMTESATGFIGSSLIVGPALQLVDALSGNQGWGSYINTGMNIATLLASGNPTGIIFQGAMELWKAVAESNQKHHENLLPGKDRGKKMGYVRQADKWMPAVFNTHYKDTGLWANEGNVNAQVGDTILYVQNAATYGTDASVQPMVINADGSDIQHNSIRMSNDDYTNTKTDKLQDLYGNDGAMVYGEFGEPLLPGSLEYVQRRDMLRNWYFADPGENLKAHDSVLAEGATPYEEQLDDWRQVMDIMGSGGAGDKRLRNQMTEYDVAHGLREIVNGGKATMRGGHGMSITGAERDKAASNYAGLHGLDTVDYHDALVKQGTYYRADMPENDWVLKEMFNGQVIALQQAQLNAAKSSGFEDRYGYDPYRDYHKTDTGPQMYKKPLDSYMSQRAGEFAPSQGYEYQPIWASLYLDTSKSLETPSTSYELRAQMDTINGYEDRSESQKGYLRQKQITRYWIEQMESRGGSQAFVDEIYGGGDTFWTPGRADVGSTKARVNNAAYDFARISMDSKADDDPWENTYLMTRHSNLDTQLGWAMPWQNAGETALPESEYTAALPESYTHNLERMHDMAVENTGTWIEEHGLYNPNMLIDGTLEKIGRVGLLETPEPGVDEPDADDPKDAGADPEVGEYFAGSAAFGAGHAGDGLSDDTLKMLKALGIDPATIQKKHDPPKTPPPPADVFTPQPVVVPPPPANAVPQTGPPPVVVPTPPGIVATGRGTVVFNEAHNTVHSYSYAPAPKAMQYTPLPSSTKHINMGFVHHMERLSAAGAVKTI